MIIYRYILKEYALCLFTITTVVLMIFMINTLAVFMAEIGAKNLTAVFVMKLVLLKTPNFLGYILPLSGFLTVLFVNGKFYATRQFDVLFASGVSRLRLMGVSMFFLFSISIVVGFLIIDVSPSINAYVKEQEAMVIQNFSIDHMAPKEFHVFSNGTAVFYADKVDHYKNLLKNIFIVNEQTTANDNGWDVVVARSGKILSDALLGKYVMLDDGYRYLGSLGHDSNIRAIHFSQFTHSYLQPRSAKVNYGAQETLFSKLWLQRKTHRDYLAWIEWYISMPISVLILGLAVFPLSRVNARSGRYAKFIPAILLYAGYVNFLYMGRDWIKNGGVSSDYIILFVHLTMLLVSLMICAIHFGWFKTCAK